MRITESKLRKIIRETLDDMSDPMESVEFQSSSKAAIAFINSFNQHIKKDDMATAHSDIEGHPYKQHFDKNNPTFTSTRAFEVEVQKLIDAASAKNEKGVSDLALLLSLLLQRTAYGGEVQYQFLYTVIMALKLCKNKEEQRKYTR